ncbi:hypothetical protein QYE76_011905 [Lolium multiflorum]|uniref:Uncharacterized protein n=1 Tax=Lolium multiflorum TaxID=4521 RepID=A0AAD8X364_LOLMU|nr:hypothetical protein QYE76_011905 [Lolium multiflorum]
MGIVVSLFRRIAVTGGHGYQSIPPCEKEENCKAMPAAVKGLKGTAFLHAHAKNWREAALAFGEQAACDLKLGDELSAASALLNSAKCYTWIHDQEEGAVPATELALQKALALFVKRDGLQMAAVCCHELAELYVEQKELQKAADFFEQAAVYYGNRFSRWCKFEADRLRFVLDNEEAHRQSDPADWRSQLYEVFATGIM